MRKKLFLRLFIWSMFFILFCFSACAPSKKLNYFNDLPDAEVINLPPFVPEERVIEKGDNIQIVISARSGEAASYFNKGGSPAPVSPTGDAGSTPSTSSASYLVDLNGFIEFPIIGKVRAFGYTAQQLKDNLTKTLTPYLKEPLVDVLFTTFNVSFLGDVRSPGTKVLAMQRTTILEGLAAAGDLPTSAKRFDVRLYRDYKGERKIFKFDLRQKEVLNNKDIFQLRHNDVIYVQTRPSIIARDEIGMYTSFLSIIIGLTTLGITLSRNN